MQIRPGLDGLAGTCPIMGKGGRTSSQLDRPSDYIFLGNFFREWCDE